jgi:transcription elongation factor Elf1
MKYEYWTVKCPTAGKVILLHCEVDKGGSFAVIDCAVLSFNVPCRYCGETHHYDRENIEALVSENPPPAGFANLL